MLYKDHAVVLRSMRYGEADRIVTFFGRAGGKVRAIAKGVRKTKSRFGGRLEPFSYLSLVLWRGRSDLDIVTQAEMIDPFRPLREELDRFALGEVMLEAIDRLIQDHERAPRTFTLLIDSLQALSSQECDSMETARLVLAGFLLRLSGQAGFAPALTRCAECDQPAGWFSPGQGGAVCGGCRSADAEELSRGATQLMDDLVREGPWMKADAESSETVLRIARHYTEYHLERRLRSARAADVILSG